MCGRYVSAWSEPDLAAAFDVRETVGEPLPPSWNVAPTDPVRIVAERPLAKGGEPVRQLRTVRWGLLPSWSRSRSDGAKMINARSETVAVKPAFKAAAARRRCLVPSSGYYEWMRDGGHKIPYFLHATDEAPLAMAGLYELWPDPAAERDDPDRWVWTCTVITRPATDLLGEIHDRCPVLVPAALTPDWLDCSTDDPAVAGRLLAAMPEPRLEPRRVGPAVGNVRNNGPELVAPA
jgi:putative SOS response-associated peptidase YedK